MRAVDRWLQRRRMQMAAPYIGVGDRLLDIGCCDGGFIEYVQTRVSQATGIDPLANPVEGRNVTILRGAVPAELRFAAESFDCITMLATLEHVNDPVAVAHDCFRMLKPGGRLILTVPHPFVDRILAALIRTGLSDGMGLGPEPHHGFDVGSTEPTFSQAGFRLIAKRGFELGLNRLFVFEKAPP
jgi:2-polyprenyl-3-methyl-5-hydroxy-6-metoxy-1,4-benzoquinol methylase